MRDEVGPTVFIQFLFEHSFCSPSAHLSGVSVSSEIQCSLRPMLDIRRDRFIFLHVTDLLDGVLACRDQSIIFSFPADSDSRRLRQLSVCKNKVFLNEFPSPLPLKPWAVTRLWINIFLYKNGIMLGLENTVHSFFFFSSRRCVAPQQLLTYLMFGWRQRYLLWNEWLHRASLVPISIPPSRTL